MLLHSLKQNLNEKARSLFSKYNMQLLDAMAPLSMYLLITVCMAFNNL